MEKKNKGIGVNCTEKEYEEIRKKAEEAGIGMGPFLRLAGLGAKVTEAPKPDVAELIRSLRRAELHLSRAEQEIREGKEFPEEEVGAVFGELRGIERKILEPYDC